MATGSFIRKIRNAWRLLADDEYRKIAEAKVKWIADNGDKMLRLYYDDINKNSIVIDAGGYEGQWASDIFSMYCCTIHIFEPVKQFSDALQKRFAKNKKIIIHNTGLSSKNEIAEISIKGDSSSVLQKSKHRATIQLIETDNFFKQNKLATVDLMKINIEGMEYDLLEHLIETGLIKNVKNIQIQFHAFIPHAKERMLRIQEKLTETHALTFQYYFVWENWKLKTK